MKINTNKSKIKSHKNKNSIYYGSLPKVLKY